MRISLIAAIAENGVIGSNGKIPWQLPRDLARFRALTLGKPIVMGRATHESIGRPLDGRHNIVVTRRANYAAPGCTVVHSPEEAIAAAEDAPEIVVIGGEAIYRALLPRAMRLYLTFVGAPFAGDAHFPDVVSAEWREASSEWFDPDEKNPLSCRFVTLERL